MNSYWIYYAATFLIAFAQQSPLLALVALGFVAFRPWLPDPVVLLRTLTRMGGLKGQVQMNPANVTARRDLALLYLDLRRPRTALRYLDEARARAPRDQEIAFLRGLALLRSRDDEGALRAFGEAVGVDADTGEPFSSKTEGAEHRAFRRFDEAFLGAAEALERLERWPQAEEALAMSARYNSSALEPLVKLARVRRRLGNDGGARDAVTEARRTFRQLPGFMRRRQLGWWLRTFAV